MAQYQTVARIGDIPEGTGIAYEVQGRMVAVFCEQGRYWAIDDLCPHMGASLAAGDVQDSEVHCPWHGWRFDIRDGTWCDNRCIQIDRFEVRVQDGEIQVLVPDAPAPEADATS